MGNRTNHEDSISELGFTVIPTDLPIVTDYQGQWSITGPEALPNNFWVVDMEGEGHQWPGHWSPQELLNHAKDEGVNLAYVAPYGRHVEGKEDAVPLHDWIHQGRYKNKHHQ